MKTLNPLAFGYAGAITSAGAMLLLSIFGSLGFYTGAMMQMMKWHMFLSPSPLGVVGGMIEAAVISFIFLYVFAIVYNKSANRAQK